MLGCLLLEAERGGDLNPMLGELKADDFADLRNQNAFRAIRRTSNKGKPVSIVGLHEGCKNGEAEKLGGLAYLSSLANNTPSTLQFPAFKETLRRATRRRGILKLGQRLVRDASDPDALPEQVIRSAEDQLQAITDHTQMPAGCLPPIKDAADLEAETLSIPPELVKGILHQGSKLAIGGGSKTYKTWLLIDLALSVAGGRDWWGIPTAKGRVLYLNLELQEVFFRK
ncbi:MAG: AAA family ATPase, partial [Verrucomicrobiota bacterium]|nr:AAA family ATPase [Verrucomicrobiota bacterium]